MKPTRRADEQEHRGKGLVKNAIHLSITVSRKEAKEDEN